MIRRKEVINEILESMSKHVGKRNAITKSKLFYQLFNHVAKETSLEDFYLNNMLLTCISYIRNETECFIVSEFSIDYKQSIYYVLHSKDELTTYCNKLNFKMEKCKKLKTRAAQSLKQKWYTRSWI